jgi:hypothetical protein
MGKKRKPTPKTKKRFYRIPKLFECPYCNCQDGIQIELHTPKEDQAIIQSQKKKHKRRFNYSLSPFDFSAASSLSPFFFTGASSLSRFNWLHNRVLPPSLRSTGCTIGCFIPLSVQLAVQSGAPSLSVSIGPREGAADIAAFTRTGGCSRLYWGYFAHITTRSSNIFEVHRCDASLSS